MNPRVPAKRTRETDRPEEHGREIEARHPATLRGKDKPRVHSADVRPTTEELRLNKFLANAGVAPRRKADEMIAAGMVRVNGAVVTELGTKINPRVDVVMVGDAVVEVESRLVYIVLNKPKDCITTISDEKGRTTVMDLVQSDLRVFPIGRLDRNTTGVLLLTNDGDLANQLMHPKFAVPRVYRAEVDKAFTRRDAEKLARGLELEDGPTAPCDVEILDPPSNHHVGLVLYEGKNREIRRMFEALGYVVIKLDRVAYAGVTVDGVKRGHWRYLEENEVVRLKKILAGHSSAL